MTRKKRWAAKARRSERLAIRCGAPAATCRQCRVLRLIRDPAYDGPLAVTHGRCSTCGRFIVQPDIAAHWRRVFAYGGPQEPKHWIERLVKRGDSVPPAERLVSTDVEMLVMPHEGRMGPFASEGD